jgi:hypothetical protein
MRQRSETSPCLSWNTVPSSMPRDRRTSHTSDHVWIGHFSLSFYLNRQQIKFKHFKFLFSAGNSKSIKYFVEIFPRQIQKAIGHK